MIVVRNTFHLKFGKAKEAQEILNEMRKKGSDDFAPDRVLTDLTGPYYTMAFEFVENDLASWEARQTKTLTDPALRPLFDRLYGLVETGNREIYNIL